MAERTNAAGSRPVLPSGKLGFKSLPRRKFTGKLFGWGLMRASRCLFRQRKHECADMLAEPPLSCARLAGSRTQATRQQNYSFNKSHRNKDTHQRFNTKYRFNFESRYCQVFGVPRVCQKIGRQSFISFWNNYRIIEQ